MTVKYPRRSQLPDRCPTCNMRAPRVKGGGWWDHINACKTPYDCRCGAGAIYDKNGECMTCHRPRITEARVQELRERGYLR